MKARAAATLSALALLALVLSGGGYITGSANWDGVAHTTTFGDNGLNDGNEFLKYDQRSTCDTTGFAENVWSHGFSPMWDATIEGVWANQGGAIAAPVACTLRVYITGLGTGVTEATGSWVFNLPGTHEWPDTTFSLGKDEVMSVYLGAAAATLDHPQFHFRVVESR